LASLKAESALLPLSMSICDMDYEAGKNQFYLKEPLNKSSR
jgi:hypothetical protein